MSAPESKSRIKNPHSGSPTPGHAAFEARLLEFLDGRRTGGGAAEIEAHLAECRECQLLRESWLRLDGEFSKQLIPPSLPLDFRKALWREIDAAAASPPVAETRAQAESELDLAWRRIRSRFVRSKSLLILDSIGISTAMGLGGYLVFRMLLGFISVSGGSVPGEQVWMIPMSLGAGALLLAGGFAFSLRNKLGRWLEAI
jgi:putative zinc finger protein